MKITYGGHACLLVEEGPVSIVIDPFLTGNPAAGLDPAKIKVNAVVLTHGHNDHFGDALTIAKNNDCPVIAIAELADYCASRGVKSHGMNLGGAYDFGSFRVKLTPAWHSSSYTDENGIVHYTGEPAGVILTIGGKTLYHSGDTALFSDMKLIGEQHRIDVAALPIGDNFTMGPDDAAIAAEWLKAGLVIPIHYNTFPVIRQDPAGFRNQLEAKGIRCATLSPGEQIDV